MDSSFIETDENKVIYTECVYWVDKLEECLEICMKPESTDQNKLSNNIETHKICKANNPENYKLLNDLFNTNSIIKKK
jgi:hypothetical protein